MLTSALRVCSVLIIAYCCVAIDGAQFVSANGAMRGPLTCSPQTGTCQGSCNSLYLWRNSSCTTSNPNPGEACTTGVAGCNGCGCRRDGTTNNCICRL